MKEPWVGLLCAITLVSASACGGSDGGTPSGNPAGPSGPQATPLTITVVGQNGVQSFSPNPAAAGGQLVVFRNADTVVHRVVLNDNTIDTGDISPGATSRAVMMPGAGGNYHCSLHPAMIGAVNPAGGGEPPPCTGIYCDGS